MHIWSNRVKKFYKAIYPILKKLSNLYELIRMYLTNPWEFVLVYIYL